MTIFRQCEQQATKAVFSDNVSEPETVFSDSVFYRQPEAVFSYSVFNRQPEAVFSDSVNNRQQRQYFQTV